MMRLQACVVAIQISQLTPRTSYWMIVNKLKLNADKTDAPTLGWANRRRRWAFRRWAIRRWANRRWAIR